LRPSRGSRSTARNGLAIGVSRAGRRPRAIPKPSLTVKDDPQPVESRCRAREMRLVIAGGGGGNWAEARLIRSVSMPVAVEPTDMAPLQRSQPGIPIGPTARRQPGRRIPAADVFLRKRSSREGRHLSNSTSKDGQGCIGLEWLELRRIREVGIQFAGRTIPVQPACAWSSGRAEPTT